jgi:O2-independent ubiquinone biosynthesis protein UbiU
MELVCPAGNLPSLKAAVANGADAVYLGLRDATNARHFAGLNFRADAMAAGIEHARTHGVRVFLAVNTYPQPDNWDAWRAAVDAAADMGVDALIAADVGVMAYAARTHPELALHLSVQASATHPDALRFFHEQFGIKRAVLPRVLSVRQVAQVIERSPVDIEVFGFGSLCIMVEGRCLLSSYATGLSPNTYGACSPASHVRWEETEQGLDGRLNGILIDRFGADEKAGYPTLCKGRFQVGEHTYYALEEPTSLSVLDLIPELMAAGVTAIKVEGRQRSPTYVAQVTAILRAAIDHYAATPETAAPASWQDGLAALSEGSQTTLGAYHRHWL